VHTLAREQFDDYVKRVRVIVHPRLSEPLRAIDDIGPLIGEAIDGAD
jgi:hypothetical protein